MLKVGDKIKVLASCDYKDTIQTVHKVEGDRAYFGKGGNHGIHSLTNIKNTQGIYGVSCRATLASESQIPGRRTFRLLKDDPIVKKGALFQEACDDGTQEYVQLNVEFNKFDDDAKYNLDPLAKLSRDAVENNPKWFEEVFPARPAYMNKAELEEYKLFQSRKKVVEKTTKVTKRRTK